MPRLRRALGVTALGAGMLLLAALAVVLVFGPAWVDARRNTVVSTVSTGGQIGAAALALHRSIAVADLHADTLLWQRDLLKRHTRGHLDVPRMQAGGIKLQVFSLVSAVPFGFNIHRTEEAFDSVAALAILQRWPRNTWNDPAARALYQIQRLDAAVAASDARLVLVRSARDLSDAAREGRIGVLLALEGTQPLGRHAANFAKFFAAGVRMVGLAHFTDTAFAGSAHGRERHGLTVEGRLLLREIETRRAIVDLAHASPKTFDAVMRLAQRPVVVSHTGVRATCDNPRNLSDAQLRTLARNGGLVGIGFWDTATCGEDASAIARAIRHAATVMGVEHVGLGSDFDGTTRVPFDAAGLPLLTEALLKVGFTPDEIRRIMGANVQEFLWRQLPPE